MRRVGEIAHILMDAGMVLIMTMVDMTAADLEIVKTVVNPDLVEVVLVGEHGQEGVSYDLQVPGGEYIGESVREVKALLQDRGVLFRP